MSTKAKQSPATSTPATVSVESIAIPQDETSTAPDTANIKLMSLLEGPLSKNALETVMDALKRHYGLPSIPLLERAVKAASLAANANSAHGDMRARMPIVTEAVKDGKATKKDGVFSVRDTEGVTRDASKLTPEQRKTYNELVATVTAAKRLGILAAKVK